MMVTRRRQSVETVVHGSGNPDSERRDPSSRDSPPGPPSDPPQDPPDDPAQGPEPSYPQYPEVRALFVTHDGGSLWVHQSAGVRGAATVSLPWDERRRAGVQGDSILFRIMHLLGAPLTAYARMGGRLHHAPLPLTNPRVETWVLMVDREVMDMAMGDPAAANVRSTSMGQPVWEWIPATRARESEMQNFDQDGLAAWSEVSNSDWYRSMSVVAAQPPTPMPFHTPLPLPAPPSAPALPPTSTAVPTNPAPALPPAHAPGPPPSARFPHSVAANPVHSAAAANPVLSPCATPFVPGIIRLPQGTNLRASSDEVRLEHKTKEMVLKLIRGVTRFPRSASDTKSADNDRDPRFQDAFWQELMRLMGVKVARTTPYNPRSDGQAEHSNRVIEDMLRSFVDANVEDWDLYTTNVEFAINDSRSESIGFTPFELVFGFSPLSQLDLFLEAAQSTAGRRTGGVGTAHEVAAKFSSQLRDARQRLELAQQRQREQFDRRHGQREYAVGDLVWIEAKHLTEKVMDRSICRKLTKRWHGPVPVTERFFSDMQMTMPEADRGAPVAYRLRLPPHWRIHDVFAQRRLKPYTSGQDAFAARDHLAVPEEVVVDGQKEAHPCTPIRDEATRRREQRGRHSAQAGMTLAHLITNPCDELDQLEQMEQDTPLPWERQERTEDGSLALVTELLAIQTEATRMPRIHVLFSGTGSVEREFLNCFPSASVVTLDSEHIWHPTHVQDILQWDYKQYPPGFFDVVWASPPCRQYSQARTTGGPPDLPQADKIVRRALQIIDYLEPKHWFMENPRGRFPNALRLPPMMRQLPPPLVCTYCMYDGQPVLIQRLLSWDLIRSRLERANPRAYIPCQRPCCDNFSDIYASARLKTRFRFQAAPSFVKVVPW
ncbi:hypothetical protein CYMTET_18277 [Cymbomonas tetramitiformis]|uniref:Integrase catalytic domain-containing protein n=1 Tax=Cymbomonas tetramitiformis TaxID=36881 RepID=A0AAE0L6G3_9CHLO|nr:hypothetical protein CYMTET_18277 [Cymbomonas tetramitiformis]